MGIEQKAIVATAVFLLAIFIIFTFETNLKASYKETAAKQTCKSSVQANSALRLRYADFSNTIQCPTTYLTINDKNENVVKKRIADAMVDCWDQFGRGHPDLFTDDNIYCTICHRITFGNNIKVNGVSEYLATKNAPRKDMTYLQFLTTEKTQGAKFLNELQKQKIDHNLDTSKMNEYAVMFVYVKGKEYQKEYMEKYKYYASGLGTIAIGYGVVKAGAAIGFTGIGAPIALGVSSVGGVIMSFGLLFGGVGVATAGVPFEHIASVSFVPYDSENLKQLNCKDVPISQQ